MKNLNEIMVFARVAQLGSFSKAAQSLEMPVSTVSRKITDLEDRLGITLIQRTTRKLNLTQIGTQYYQQCAELLLALDEAETRITQLQSQPEGPLRITIPVGMGSGQFIEFISGFLNRYPKIQLDLLVSNQYVDLVSENVDLAIRFGALHDSSLIARRLGTSMRALVASPEYLKRRGSLKHPQDLEKHECIIYRSRTEDSVWEFTKEKSRQKAKVAGRIVASDMSTLKELAIRGHGIAHLPEMFCLDAIQEGSLRLVLPEWKSLHSPVHAVYPNRRFMPTRLTTFLKELEEWKSPSWER